MWESTCFQVLNHLLPSSLSFSRKIFSLSLFRVFLKKDLLLSFGMTSSIGMLSSCATEMRLSISHSSTSPSPLKCKVFFIEKRRIFNGLKTDHFVRSSSFRASHTESVPLESCLPKSLLLGSLSYYHLTCSRINHLLCKLIKLPLANKVRNR